jgi:hypothetical protein
VVTSLTADGDCLLKTVSDVLVLSGIAGSVDGKLGNGTNIPGGGNGFGGRRLASGKR